MRSNDDGLPMAEVAERLGVGKPRIVQLLSERCTFAGAPTFELDSPQGPPVGTTRVADRTVTLSSIEAYEERHPPSASGRRRKRHPAAGKPRPTPPRSSASVQVLRLELEHQLGLNQQLAKELEDKQHQAIEQARALNHRIVDLQADLDLKDSSATSLASNLAGLQSAFDAYGEVFTQDVGPQDPSST